MDTDGSADAAPAKVRPTLYASAFPAGTPGRQPASARKFAPDLPFSHESVIYAAADQQLASDGRLPLQDLTNVQCGSHENQRLVRQTLSLQAPGGGFQTAKDKHAADLRAKGLAYPRREACGGVGGGNTGRLPLSGPAHLATRAVLGRGRGVAGAPAAVCSTDILVC